MGPPASVADAIDTSEVTVPLPPAAVVAPVARVSRALSERKVPPVAKPATTARVRTVEAPAKVNVRAQITSPRPKPTASPARKGIDQEFGF